MLLEVALFILVYFITWYAISLSNKNAGLVDIGWGLGFVLIAILTFSKNINLITTITTLLITLWGLRLSYHIFIRNYGKPEDKRYKAWREQWGKTYYVRSFFQLFLLQGFFMFLISLTTVYINDKAEITYLPLFIVGILVWVIGYFFEVRSDYELKKFLEKEANKGKIIQTGLWKYSRHPNYFGEATMWWGIYLIGLAVEIPYWTIISPITITMLVRYISGVPLLEKRLKEKPGYKEYMETTSVFIPWFKKGRSK